MGKFTSTDRSFCLRAYYESGCSLVKSRRAFLSKHSLKKLSQCPSIQLLKSWIKKSEEEGIIERKQYKPRQRTSRSNLNISVVNDIVRKNPRLSQRRISSVAAISKTSVQRILKRDLKLHPYKFQMAQALNQKDFEKRLQFAVKMEESFRCFENIIFSDEAHFYLNGMVNKQNFRFYSEENPQLIKETCLHPQKVTVWAGLASWGIIGPYFFEDSRGAATTINQAGYQTMLRDFLGPELKNHRGYNRNTWFQQDGATPHTTKQSLAACNDLFPQQVISLRGNIEWPPRSPDLSPLDFFLWGYLKDKVYINNPGTLDELKKNISEEMMQISKATLKRVVESFAKRLNECKSRNGEHLCDVIFKK